jgi:5-methylcytosine-specific restriction endonuclease McrA
VIPNTPFNPGEDREPTSPWYCPHRARQLVVRTYANGAASAWEQCTACGQAPKAIKSPVPLAELPPWDEGIRERFAEQGRAELERRRNAVAEERATRSVEWWAWYDSYRETPRWQELRHRVLERARGTCEAYSDGCTRIATQVHHLTYDHVGDEPIFDLVAICKHCHDKITTRDRENRKVA